MNIGQIVLIVLLLFLIKRSIKSGEKIVMNKDFMNPSVSLDLKTEYKPFNSSYKKAWTDSNIEKNPKHHTSYLEGEKTNIGDFFDKDNKFIDYKRSKNILPDRCFIDNNEVVCEFNNKIENPPPTLIEDKENNMVLKSIGDDNDIETNIISSKNIVFGNTNHNVWEYKEEKTINGGKYFGNVTGYSDSDGTLRIETIKNDSKNYSF